MAIIATIHGREILDSRGTPTVEVEVTLDSGVFGRASVPSGASTGTHEALELRDQEAEHFAGKGVTDAVEFVNTEISQAVIGQDANLQTQIDTQLTQLDGTPNLSRLGANAILGVSLAVSKAAALELKIPYFQYVRQHYNMLAQAGAVPTLTTYTLPTPLFNIINGGAHTDWQTTDFQEFMIVPQTAASFKEVLEQGSETYHVLEKILMEKKLSTLVGDEGGFAPNVTSNEEAIELILQAITKSGLVPGQEMSLALDPAVSEIYKNGSYHLKNTPQPLSSAEMINYWERLVRTYPIISIEDGLAEDDWSGWQELYRKLGSSIMIVGDDLLVTNSERIAHAIELSACNALLLKVNQIGTLTHALQAAVTARKGSWRVIVSHRSGETEDTAIADIAVGIKAEYVKMGAPARGERTAKYNQLLRIEELLSNQAVAVG